MKQENVWKSYSPEQLKELEELSVRYRAFLDAGKTEQRVRKGDSAHRKRERL